MSFRFPWLEVHVLANLHVDAIKFEKFLKAFELIQSHPVKNMSI